MHTGLPVVVFDPNGDFVRLAETRPEADETERNRLSQRDIRVLRPGDGPDALRIRFLDMSIRSKGAIFQLDPLIDREAFNVLVRWRDQLRGKAPSELVAMLNESDEPGAKVIAQRIENLGLFDWTLWAADRTPATEIIADRPAATVLDIGSFPTQD